MIQSNEQVMVELRTLMGAEYNPRIMQPVEMERLKQSLQAFGFVQPVVARAEDGLIIGGHQRVAAYIMLLKEKGLTDAQVAVAEVPAILLRGLDDTRTKLLNVALNKISGEWDYEKLADLFSSLDSSAPIELSGYSKDDVEGMMSLLGGATPLVATPTLDEDIAQGLAAQARRFVFSVETDADAAACSETLKAFGMTGPGNAAEAFVRALKAAGRPEAPKEQPELVEAAAKPKKIRRKKTDDDDHQEA